MNWNLPSIFTYQNYCLFQLQNSKKLNFALASAKNVPPGDDLQTPSVITSALPSSDASAWGSPTSGSIPAGNESVPGSTMEGTKGDYIMALKVSIIFE